MKTRSILSLIISGLIWFSITCFSNPAFGLCILNTTAINATCFNDNDGSVAVEVNTWPGSYPYTFQWFNGAGTTINQDTVLTGTTIMDTATGLSPGTYIIKISDVTGFSCSDTIIVGPDDITFSLYPFDESCGNMCDGSIVMSTAPYGGSPPYTYLWSNGATSPDISGICAGIYDLTVTDNTGCTKESLSYTILADPEVYATSIVNESCVDSCNGSITLFVNSNWNKYYDWSWNNNTSNSTNQNLSNLCSDTYLVTVTTNLDNQWCYTETSFVVSSINPPINPSITANDATCGNSNGTAIVTVNGGVPPFSYSWSTGETTSSISGLVPGLYTVQVTDDAGCTDTDIVTVGGTGAPTINDSSLNILQSRCDSGTGKLTGITVSGGTPPYTYLWDDFGAQATLDATGLVTGDYILMVTDSFGCNNIAGPFNVPNFPSPTISITKDDETCSNADGKACGTVLWGTAPYTYSWDDPGAQTDSCATGLIADTFIVTVYDINGCSALDTTIITDTPGPDSLSFNNIPVKCNGGSDGVAMTTVFGGTSPYTYLWNNNSPNANIGNLSAGTYSVIVTDANACTISDSVIISSPLPLTATFAITDPTCFGDCDGKIEANIVGGIPPYLLNGQPNTIANGVCAGNYPTIIKDSNNCTFYSMAIVNDPLMIELTINVTDASCGESDGSAVISGISNGTPPYLYQWTSGSTDSIADSLGAGMYMVTITDSSGCGNFGLAVVSDQDGPNISVNSVNNVTCHGNGDGAISIDVTGGLTPYTYFWSNGAMVEDINNLTAGPYEITIYDANGCTASKSIPVFGPQRIELTMARVFPNCGQNDGMVAVSISEGTPPYSINWSTGDTTDTITNLTWGVYHVSVTDDNGCVRYGAAPLGEQGGTSVQIDSVIDVACGGSGAISVTVNGGTPPFNYSWYKDSVLVDSVEDLQGVSTGTYDLIINDSNGCMGAANATISGIGTNPEPICIVTVDSITGTNVIVWEKNDTTIASYNIYKESTMAGVYYLIDNVPFASPDSSFYNDTVSNPKTRAWRYKISVIDSCGNESDFSEVHKTMHLTINLSITPNEYNLIWDHYEGIVVPTYVIERYHPSTDWDSLDAVPSNLTSYIDDASSLPDQNNIYYRIRVSNPSGCYPSKTKNYNSSKSNTSAISLGAILSATASSTDATQGNCDGTATVSASGGSAPYTYLWNDPMAQTNISATGLCPGTFLVIVVDAFGDSISASAIVLEISALSLTASSTDADFGSSNGTATVTATGGTLPYTYLWDASAGFQTTPTAAGLFAGIYTVTVTESLGNNESINVTVNELTAVAERQGLDNVLIYPNPGLGVLVIELKQAQQKYGTLQIYNLVGKLVRSQTIHSQKTYIDLSNEGPGIYTLKLKASERMVIRKIIIE